MTSFTQVGLPGDQELHFASSTGASGTSAPKTRAGKTSSSRSAQVNILHTSQKATSEQMGYFLLCPQSLDSGGLNLVVSIPTNVRTKSDSKRLC